MTAARLVRARRQPELREMQLPGPGPGHVLVRVAGAGACRSDPHGKNVERFPLEHACEAYDRMRAGTLAGPAVIVP